MPDIRCPSCHKQTNILQHNCAHCGATLQNAEAKKPETPPAVTVFMLGVMAVVAFWLFGGESEPDAPAAPPSKEEMIAQQFNPMDGGHYRLERLIKQNLNDPDSYQHDQTRYTIGDESLTVYTSYRARNAFGGMVREEVVARVDMQGNVIEIVSE